LSENDIKLNKDKKKFKLKIEYVLVVVLIVAVIIIFLSNNSLDFLPLKPSQNNEVSYKSEVENSLQTLLENVVGVGKVKVMVTVDGTTEEVVLKNIETKIENNVKNTIETIVLINGKPYVTKLLNPKIIGVIVVCEGADNLQVKMTITEILATTLKVDADSVRIIKMK
jgi:stage III sporulation protein AG